MALTAGCRKVIHINQHEIKANRKDGRNRPVVSVKHGKANTYGHEVEIQGPSKVVYSPHAPLKCGARVWVETDAEVIIKQKDHDDE